jgi:hypothetical protein
MPQEEKKLVEKSSPLDDKEISLMKKYGMSVYAEQIKSTGEQNNDLIKQIN